MAPARLRDGSRVGIRQIRVADAPALLALHGRLSERSRYLRYFWPCPRMTPADLHSLTHVDHREREALVMHHRDQLIAVGQYERLASSDADADAEVAVLVEDAHQCQGAGALLLTQLASSAAHAGVARFVADLLPDNAPVIAALAAAGYRIHRQHRPGVIHVRFPIWPARQATHPAAGVTATAAGAPPRAAV